MIPPRHQETGGLRNEHTNKNESLGKLKQRQKIKTGSRNVCQRGLLLLRKHQEVLVV